MDSDSPERAARMNPDAIQRHNRPRNRKCRGSWRPAKTTIEHVRRRSARQPVVEITKHDDEGVTNGLQVLDDLPYLKSPLVNAQTKVRGEHMKLGSLDIDRRRKRTARLAARHRQIDAMHFDNPMARQQCIAKALGYRAAGTVTCGAQRARIPIQRRQDHRLARFDRDARWIRELLQRDDVGIQLCDDRRDAIGIVAAISSYTRVDVVGCDPQRRRHYPNSALVRWLDTAAAN